MQLPEPQKRLKEIAIREIDDRELQSLGYITEEDLYEDGKVVTVVKSILSRYYEIKKNQTVIDAFMKKLSETLSTPFGAVSSDFELDDLLSEMETMLIDFKS